MAVITANNASAKYQTNDADMLCLIAVRNVTTGDTLDLSTVGIAAPVFTQIKRAVVLGATVFVEIAAAFAGTVVTMPAGLANDGAYLLVWGC